MWDTSDNSTAISGSDQNQIFRELEVEDRLHGIAVSTDHGIPNGDLLRVFIGKHK